MLRAQVGFDVLILMAAVAFALSACSVPSAQPVAQLPPEGPRIELSLFTSADGPARADAVYDLPAVTNRETVVRLGSVSLRPMPARVVCDAPARLRDANGVRALRAGSARAFTIPARHEPGPTLELSPAVRACSLRWGAGHHLALRRLDETRPALARLDRQTALCTVPPTGSGDALSRRFYASTALSESCAVPSGRVDLAVAPLDALNARIEALTGQRIAEETLRRGDPDLAFDYSRAPRLDLIVMSYLHIRADYSGHLVRRMITWHAARGTAVRILVSSQLMLPLDRVYWESLAARYPNVQIQYYRWNPKLPGGPADLVDRAQRSNHTKVFLTLAREPGRSRFIIGGRNLHDGFFFDQSFEMPGHPELRHYPTGQADTSIANLAWHTYYEDFEIVMHDDAVVRRVASHFSRLWFRDDAGALVRGFDGSGVVGAVPQDGVVRHFLSLPWADGQAMQALYVDLIDAAGREVIIVSPFLYPPPAIEQALERADRRGVRVVLITRLGSTDPPAFFTTAFDHRYLNRVPDTFELWNYEPQGHLTHAKIVVIDSRLAIVASTNLNARSFFHDSENGVILLDRAVARRIREVTKGYMRAGVRLRPPLAISPTQRAVGDMRWLWQYF